MVSILVFMCIIDSALSRLKTVYIRMILLESAHGIFALKQGLCEARIVKPTYPPMRCSTPVADSISRPYQWKITPKVAACTGSSPWGKLIDHA